ncbi:helix-turn-helix domain-containing protein [Virgibacillus soli]|uniref:helix-turn-helix domain-containing protein n=1 Tax=Paracerasibacillus soli TaxID=480284 RepID=UPI0035EAA76B
MDIGTFIKIQRLKKEMTQEELAHGIVSMSYLSKIENSRTEATPEVINMLCARLGIQLDGDRDITINEKCEQWYKSLFEVNNRAKITTDYEELEQLVGMMRSDSLIMFEIHKIRYFLVLGENEKALEQINKLNDMSKSFDNLHQYYWYKFRGNYNYLQGEFSHAMKMYKHAEEKQQNHLMLSEEEIADLQYVISVTHSKLRNTLESIKYADQAIEVYRKYYNFFRCAQCHILLGISYRRIKMTEKAIKHYNLARHLGEINKNNHIMQLTNQNLGYLYTALGEPEKAITYFEHIYADENVKQTDRLTALISLITEYYDIRNIDKTRQLIETAVEWLELIKDDVNYKLYYYVTYTYKLNIDKQYEQFEELVAEKFIPFLQKQRDFGHLVVYAKMLAEYYESTKRYKDSVKYYKLVTKAYDHIANL